MADTMGLTARWTLREVSDGVGVSYRTLRFYEQVGLLSAQQDGTGPSYSDRDLIKIAVIRQGRKLGLSLAFIADLLRPGSSEGGGARSGERVLPSRIADWTRQRDETATPLDKLQDALRARRQEASVRPMARLTVDG